MKDEELRGRLVDLHERLERVELEASRKGHFVVILLLLVLVARGCGA